MRKIALALLFVFSAFVWACDDGLDERASLGTVYVDAAPAGSVNQLDLYTWVNIGDPAVCTRFLKTDALTQTFNFNVFKNPNYNGTLSRVKVTKVERRFSSQTAGAPDIPSNKQNVSYEIYNNTEFPPEIISYTKSIPFQLFSGSDYANIANVYDMGGYYGSIEYNVEFKFTVLELSTGIEDEIYGEGVTVTFADYREDGDCAH
jgi:hypothetical protein